MWSSQSSNNKKLNFLYDLLLVASALTPPCKDGVLQYLELRFGRSLRVLAALLYPLQSLLYLGVALYAPALALQTLSDISLLCSVLTVGLVCTFYSALGGIKAVIITDVVQVINKT